MPITNFSLGDDDPAVEKLSVHFDKVIDDILTGDYMELPTTSTITKELTKKKKKKFFFNFDDCKNLWRRASETKAQWLGEQDVPSLLPDLREKVQMMSFSLLCSR